MFYEQSEDYRPLFWVQGRAVYANTLLLILHVVAFVGLALCGSFIGPGALYAVELDTDAILRRAEVWRLATYVISPPSILFIFALGLLYFVGKEVERFVGRRIYLQTYAAIVLIPALLLTLAGLYRPQAYLGSWESIFGVFIAYATIYPGVSFNIFFVELTTKAWAWALLAVYTLVDVYDHNWTALELLWLCAAVGFISMRLAGAGSGMTWLTDWLERRRAERLARERNFKIVQEKHATDSMDAILEKISRQGVGSLGPRERAVLERARADLIKRDQR